LRLLAALPLALALGCARAAPADGPPADRDRFHLFLLAGQSNMAGRGVVEPEDRVPHPRVWMLDAEGRWVPAVDPVHFDKPNVAGVGPGRAFALAVAEAEPGVVIGLIPTAVGGSPIVAWEPGGVHAQAGTRPYDDAVARARAAMRDGTLKAVLWHQGESDSNEAAAPRYEERLAGLVQRLRRDLDAPDLPFLVGGLTRFEGRSYPS